MENTLLFISLTINSVFLLAILKVLTDKLIEEKINTVISSSLEEAIKKTLEKSTKDLSLSVKKMVGSEDFLTSISDFNQKQAEKRLEELILENKEETK